MIFIGIRPVKLRDKLMARHPAHSVEHAKVADAALRELRAHHLFALSLGRIGLEWVGHRFYRRHSPAYPRWTARRLYLISVWTDDPANAALHGARSGRHSPRLLLFRFDDIEILVSAPGIEEHDRVFGAKEAAGAQLLIGNQ